MFDFSRFQHQHPKVAHAISSRGFFIANAEELATIVLFDRLALVHVRCGSCRFTCPAQDVNHLVEIINADPKGRDYVRDISLNVR